MKLIFEKHKSEVTQSESKSENCVIYNNMLIFFVNRDILSNILRNIKLLKYLNFHISTSLFRMLYKRVTSINISQYFLSYSTPASCFSLIKFY